MKSTDLVKWMHTHRYSNSKLATSLGVHRNTVSYWLRGDYGPPVDLAQRLAALLKTDKPPEYVIQIHAHLRPDLALFIPAHKKGLYGKGPEHPCRLLGIEHPAPWAVLEIPEYKAALAEHRAAQTHKRANATPAALTALMERGIAEQSS